MGHAILSNAAVVKHAERKNAAISWHMQRSGGYTVVHLAAISVFLSVGEAFSMRNKSFGSCYLVLAALAAVFVATRSGVAADKPPEKIKMLIVTGGHGFDPPKFFKLFDDDPEISYIPAKETDKAEAWDRDDLLSYDVILLYDFQRELNDSQKAKFLSLLDKGVGLVVLHHALLSYQNWPEYERIAGGKYLLDNETVNGKRYPASTYKGNVDIDVKVVDKQHPVTAGLEDFILRDEIYRGVRNGRDIHVLCTTEGNPLAWTRQEKKSRVFSTIVGHGPAYDDAKFQKLLASGIRWSARRIQHESTSKKTP
jgi:hypothetical protein